jgi:SAM-dependent methyltransferase
MSLTKWVKRYFGKAVQWPTSLIGSKKLAKVVYFFIYQFSAGRDPKESLIFLLELERYLFSLAGTESCRYGQGIHTKHRHTRYHDFFTRRVQPGNKVLDIGCGNGILSYDMARAGALVVALDIEAKNIAVGQKRFAHPNLKFIHGNALEDLPAGTFDVITLSNVLEHIKDRVGFLSKIQKTYDPDRWIIRVPSYERDWRVPLMDEIGVDSRLDGTHYIEYSQESFIEELQQAGLTPVFLDIRWGEIWCEAGCKKKI